MKGKSLEILHPNEDLRVLIAISYKHFYFCFITIHREKNKK